jgi:hypothetical protein
VAGWQTVLVLILALLAFVVVVFAVIAIAGGMLRPETWGRARDARKARRRRAR